MIGNLRLVLDVEVMAGNEVTSKHSMPGLTSLLSNLDKHLWPQFVRGDCDWGSDPVMNELESMGTHYLFKMKKHKRLKSLYVRRIVKVLGLFSRMIGKQKKLN